MAPVNPNHIDSSRYTIALSLMKIGFLYNAQVHQISHSAPMAFELSIRYPHLEVTIIVPTTTHLAFLQDLGTRYPDHRCSYVMTQLPHVVRVFSRLWSGSLPPKLLTLVFNRRLFSTFDALVVPERTSLALKKLGLTHLKLIHSGHGAGDREVAVDPRLKKFDLLLIAGRKLANRLLTLGLVQEDGYALVGYCKFDVYHENPPGTQRLFSNANPIVLYNPHFRPQFSSWATMGKQILEWFANTSKYNLIFAPHIRLFEGTTMAQKRQLQRYTRENILVDLGSDASVNMTYTHAADIYLGDISSQVYEFLIRPRPCIFLNAHSADWKDNPNYLCWECGPVISNVGDLASHLDAVMHTHTEYRPRQEALVQYTFDTSEQTAGSRGADAIAAYLAMETKNTEESG